MEIFAKNCVVSWSVQFFGFWCGRIEIGSLESVSRGKDLPPIDSVGFFGWVKSLGGLDNPTNT